MTLLAWAAAGRPVHRAATAERWSWLDVRLVPAALTVWSLTLLTPLAPPAVLAGTSLAAALAALGVLAGRRSRQGSRAAAVALVLAAATVTCGLGAVRLAGMERSALHDVDGDTVGLVLELDTDPQVLPGIGPPRVLVEATATALLDADGSRELMGDPVLLFAPLDGWAGLLPGQRVRVQATVRPAEAGDDVVAVVSARGPPALTAGPGRLQDAAGDVRSGLSASAARVLPAREAGLLPGLVVGDTSGMDPLLVADFRRAGLAHLTAVSGANVAIVLTLLLWPLRRRLVDRRWQAVLGALGIAGFVLLARPEPSVLRAAAMGAVALLALASGRSRAAVPALAAVVVVLLLVSPGLATDPGFALSVVATAAIVLLSPRWSRSLRRRRLPGPLADALAVTAAAGLATAPLVAGLSGQVSLVSLPANLLAAPAVAPATVLGLGAALLAPVAPWAADGLSWLAGWPVRWLVGVAERAAAVPDGATGWPTGVRGALLLTLLLGGVAWALVRWPRLRPLALVAVLALVVLGWPVRQVTRGWPPADAVVVACEVGQGDALVVPTGPGAGVLVDAGPDAVAVDGCLDRLGIDRLPLVVLSHLDADHVHGLVGALTGREVGEVVTGTLSPADDRVPGVDAVISAAGGTRTVLVPGDRRTVGTAEFEALAPRPELATASANANDLSLVLRLTQRGLSVLFTGDLGAEAEAGLVRDGVDLRADVLKVPHHGSGDVDPGFLAATGARVALISVGADNTYGHPAGTLLRYLAEDGMRVLRTDRDGDLAVVGSAGEWGTTVGGPGAVSSAAPAPSVPRDTILGWPPDLPNRRPGSGSSSARRSCCGPARSPPSVPRRSPATPAPRSTRWPRWACRSGSSPTRWRPRCSAVTGWSS